MTPALPDVPDWPEAERLAREKEALGFFISGHPLDRHRDVVRAFERTNTRNLAEHAGKKIELACVVTGVARQVSRRDGTEWGKLTVEDFHGTATVLAFREAWQANKERLRQDAAVLLRGAVSNRERDEEDPPIFLDEVLPLSDLAGSGALAVRIELESASAVPGDAFTKARTLIASRPGSAPLELVLGPGNGGSTPCFRSRTLRLDPDEATLAELQKLFGKGHVRLVRREAEAG